MNAPQVTISVEKSRGCGYRKPAKDGVGIYLVGPEGGYHCSRLPFELRSCSTCGGGWHASRGWNWIEPMKVFQEPLPKIDPSHAGHLALARLVEAKGCGPERLECGTCPLGRGTPEGKHGLVWIGEKHYPTAASFMEEALAMGVSRKIKAVPKDFEPGKTVVYLAHRKAVPGAPLDRGAEHMGHFEFPEGNEDPKPGIFSAFRPTAIDLVIEDAKNVPEKAVKLAEKYGARIVQVVRDESLLGLELARRAPQDQAGGL